MMYRPLSILLVTALLLSAGSASAQDFPGSDAQFQPRDGYGAWAPYGGYPPPANNYNQSLGYQGTQQRYGLAGRQSGPMGVTELLPEQRQRGPWYEEDRPFEREFKEAVAQSWVRFDYLLLNVTDPEDQLIGAPLSNFDARQRTLQVNERDGTDRIPPPIYRTFVPTTSFINQQDINGVRATIGFPTPAGGFELSAWTTKTTTDALSLFPIVDPEIPIATLIPSTTFLIAGQPATVENAPRSLYDTSYLATYRTRLFGSDAKFVGNKIRSGSPIQIQGIAGFKYVRLEDQFDVGGIDALTATLHNIHSESLNHIFGPTLGFRAEAQIGFLTLGVEPALFLGFNRHENFVSTKNLFTAAELDTISGDHHSEFAPGAELKTYMRAQCGESLQLHVGYDITVLTKVSRPVDNILYTDLGVNGAPASTRFRHGELEDVFIRGLNAGATISW